MDICGDKRNSYSKTDHDATFMRVKKDYMGNDQLLPAYNVQMGICDGYIAVYGVYQYASDSDCLQPLVEEFKRRYHKYPKYPDNLNSIHGALLRMNRSIQSEGTYGEIKANRGYERFRRRGINKAILEIALISCGFNLHKYHLSRLAKAKTTKAAG